MASERESTDSNDFGPPNLEGLNLSDCTGATPRFRYPKLSLSLSANNSFRCSPQSDESSTSYFDSVSDTLVKRQRRKTGFARKLPPMGIFWDIENVRVPRNKSAAAVVQRIREVFLENYRESEFVVVCDVKRENPLIIQELHDTQVNLIHVSSISKNAADEKLRQSLRRFADIHPAPSAIILISGDINFASDLSDLRYRKKIRIILIHNVNVADALILCANEHYLFTTLTENVPASNGRRIFERNTSSYLTVSNLPKHMEGGRVKNRLNFLTNNCGGKFMEFFAAEGIANLRFGTFDLALRAQKRIQGEDVYGHKICVSAPSIRSYTGQRVKSCDRSFNQHPGPFSDSIYMPRSGNFQQHMFANLPPPPGFENRQQSNAYPYHSSDIRGRKQQDILPTLRTPPICLDRTGPPSFPPVSKMGPPPMPIGGPSCASPMEMSYEQLQGGFNRRTPASKQGASHDQLNLGTCALPPFGRVRWTSGSSEYSDSDAKGYTFNEFSTKSQVNQPVDLNITNLDPTIDVKELRRLLTNMIKENAMILSLNVMMQPDGTSVANLRVSSQQEAQFIISQLHRQKLGHKRITIGYDQNNSPDPEQLKLMVISILQDAPDKRMPLFKFMELLDSRYHCTVSVSEVNKLKDIVRINDDRGSRVISLTEEAKASPSHNLTQNMIPHCIIHCPKSMQNIGWCELNSSFIPNIMMPLSNFTPKLMTLLIIHFGSMPLLSFQTCYEQEYNEPLPVSENGVPLEHLITCVPGVEIKLVGPNKSIKFVQSQPKQSQQENGEEQVLKTVAPSLTHNVNLLCREVVDLLKNMDRCQILMTKFIPAYHQHFGRQCRVADYGYTKLLDLFEAISHVVQIMGDGCRRVITLTHPAQVRRFTSDLLRVLKVQPNKQILIQEFANAYERVLNKPFNPVEYGLCTLDDLLYEIPENTVVVTSSEEGVFISIPKKEQTAKQAMKTKQFANEVIDLLRHTPHYTMLFNKFVPSYHHHFGHQCKVSDYGFAKLIELFEAIPDVVEIKEIPNGDRTVSLTPQQSLKILGAQLLQVIRNNAKGALNLNDLLACYFREFGYRLNPQAYQCDSLEEVVDKLSDYVEVVHSNAGSLLRPVEMDTSPNILRVRCWALLLCPPHVKDLPSFRYEYRQCYNNNFTVDALRKISNVVSLSSTNNSDFISLTALYVLAAQLYYVICNNGGAVEFSQLENTYEQYYNKPLNLKSFSINTVNEFYNCFNLMFYIRGSKKKSVVVLNRNLHEHIASKYDNNNVEVPLAESTDTQWNKTLPSTSLDTSQGVVRKYAPPKPDTPPTPGSTLWWNSPTKFDQQSLNFSINMPLTVDASLLNQSDDLMSNTCHLLALDNNPWNSVAAVAPEPHELPLPDKLLAKSGMSDDSGDSGVNILLENSPSDNELDPSTSENKGVIKKNPYYGTYLNFK